MFKRRNFTLLSPKWAHLKFGLKKLAHGQQRAKKRKIFGPSQTTLHHSSAWFCHWHYKMGPGILPETTVGKHNLLCHPQMPTKALSSKALKLYAQTSSNCFEKQRRCYTMVNMPPSQLIWNLQQASNLKCANFVHKIVQFLSLNICYVIYVLLWAKYWLVWFGNSFSFHFIVFPKFSEFGLYLHSDMESLGH